MAAETDEYKRPYEHLPGMQEALDRIKPERWHDSLGSIFREQMEMTRDFIKSFVFPVRTGWNVLKTIMDDPDILPKTEVLAGGSIESRFLGKVEQLKDKINNLTFSVFPAINFAIDAVADPGLLPTIQPMVQDMRLQKALEELSTIPEGKKLVDALKKSGTKLELTNKAERGAGGAAHTEVNVTSTGVEMVPTQIFVSGYAPMGKIISILAHELQHNLQAVSQTLRPLGESIPSPIEQLWHNRAIEADAQATAIDIAWKLKEAGKPKAWEQISDPGMCGRALVHAYERQAKADPTSVQDGRAKRAAFDQWFVAKNVFGEKLSSTYNHQGAGTNLNVEKLAQAAETGLPFAPMKVETIQKLGDLSPVNYLKGGRPLDDPYYRKADWNASEAGYLNRLHTKYDAILAEKSGGSKFMTTPKPAASVPEKTAMISLQRPAMKAKVAGMKM